MGSYGSGVFLLTGDSVFNLSVKEGLLSEYCYSLTSDNNHNIWVGHKGGLSKINTEDLMVKSVRNIEGIPGNISFNPNSVACDREGKIWFGSDKGLVCYDPSMEYPFHQAPVLGIRSVKVNDEEVDFTVPVLLPAGNYKIMINYLGVSLKEPEQVNYQFKLDGYEDWSEITRDTSVTYRRISDGSYTFVLKASSGDGVVTKIPVTLSLIIKKPVWKKWWFYFAIVIFLNLIMFMYLKRREHLILAEKRVLEEKVKERTREIQLQKNEIEQQRDLIREKNNNITSSIRYASHIQEAVMPVKSYIDELLPDNFILNKPRDIVSGDFYWLTEKDGKIVFAVADCTGHGVPGAFMSLLGITLLDEIVNIQGITAPDAIMEKLRERVIQSLHQRRKKFSTTDGMDIALCVLDKEKRKLYYTGGMNDIVFIRDDELGVLKADRLSVCILHEEFGSFSMREIDYQTGDMLYLFSDGYKDQFGGENDKKFLARRFYETLLEINKMPVRIQKVWLEKKLFEWMGSNTQTDDIIIMGVRMQ